MRKTKRLFSMVLLLLIFFSAFAVAPAEVVAAPMEDIEITFSREDKVVRVEWTEIPDATKYVVCIYQKEECVDYYETESTSYKWYPNILGDFEICVNAYNENIKIGKSKMQEHEVGKVYWDAAVMYGDVDGDYEITVKDATQIQKHLAGLVHLQESHSETDPVQDGEVNIKDATAIQKYVAGLDNYGLTGEYYWFGGSYYEVY